MSASTSGLEVAITNALYPIKAHLLPAVCERYGLAAGTGDEAFNSKTNYIMRRLVALPRGKWLEIAQEILLDYHTDELEKAVSRASQSQPADSDISNVLSSFDEQGVHAAWRKALARRQNDPEGAITSARTLLETVCKHIIDNSTDGSKYEEKDDLPKLYRTAAHSLNLAPDQHTEETFKQILGGCRSVVEGLGTMRNKLSDAHGRGRKPVRPAPRHAALAVNLAGSMATFLIETWNDRPKADL